MNKLERILNNTLMPAALAVGMYAMPSNAATVMTVDGPFVTTGDYISNGTGVLEQRWRYDITNTSTVGDVNNMIEWHINAGKNEGILEVRKIYGGPTLNITQALTLTTAGFTGLLPPSGFNSVSIYVYTPADTQSAPGLATATARGNEYEVPFNSAAVQVPTIPEPSSGLLLLLGAGALAYQRKR